MVNSKVLISELFRKGKYTLFMALIEKGVYFLIFIYFARTTDVMQYGALVSAFAFANILNSFFEFGFGAYFQREAASLPARLAERFNAALGFRIASFAAYALATLGYYLWTGLPASPMVAVISLTIYLSGFGSLLSRTLYGLDRYQESFVALTKSRALIPVGILILLVSPLPPSFALYVLLAAVAWQTASLAACLRRSGVRIAPSLGRADLGNVLRSSLPMGIGVAFVWIYDKIDVLLIGNMIGAESVSYYSVAYSLYKLPQIAAGVLLTPLFTELSARFASRGSIRLGDVRTSAVLLVGFALGLIALLNIAPGALLSVVYGRTYGASGPILGMLAFALPGLFLNNLTGAMLNAVRQERKAMLSAFGALIVNVAINAVFLVRIGIVAAVIATIAAEYCILLLQCWYLKRSARMEWSIAS